jgi:predicted Rossmann-fold nucleotide-binding protein
MSKKKDHIVRVNPTGLLGVLSQHEVARLKKAGQGGLHDLFRRCALAVVNCGSEMDDPHAVLDANLNFDIGVIQQDRGIKLEVVNAPQDAFVDGQMIEGIRELLFDVLRDIVFVNSQIQEGLFNLEDGDGITHAVFAILRHAGLLQAGIEPNLAVCWGGHSIPRREYDYTKEVGYQMGLRGIDICTGCGPGAMKGPMKGATIAHRKQRVQPGRYVGISEPGIIAAESPNPIVNLLIIMPDIEKRLEAFVRVGHGIIVFPGGVGTAEEILYLLGILLHPANRDQPFPVVFTGPEHAADYFRQIDDFIGHALGDDARKMYDIIIDDPVAVARRMKEGMREVREYRKHTKDAYFFNWGLTIHNDFQKPFEPTHENMAGLQIHHDQETHMLAANLRRVFSGIVAGNVKEYGIQQIKERGPFQINGDPEIMQRLDRLLAAFVEQQRMKLPGTTYVPCYEVRSG